MEKLGGDTNVLADIGIGETITIRKFGQFDIAPGAKIELDFDDSDSFLFDQSGKRIKTA